MEKEEKMQNIRNFLPEENLKEKEPMSKHTSFKVGGAADYYITATTVKQIQNILKYAKQNNIEIYIIGNGSNLLVKDKGFRGIILKVALDSIEIDEQQEGKVIVTTGAGTKIMALAQTLKQKGITGFEELSGVPGTIGGANVMNAGAYGKEVKDIIVETTVLNKETETIETISKEKQDLTYRNSIFKKGKYILLKIKMQLQKGNEKEIEQKMLEHSEQRKQKQPVEYPSAGSTFKRGDGFITAKLIDECGLKGYSIGGAQISEKHAGFIINKGNATAKDIIDLIEYTKKKVFEKFKVTIDEEIEIIGED